MNERVVITGASGLIGRALTRALRARGTEAHALVRREPRHEHEHVWDPARGRLDPAVLAGASALVSLGGASVGRLPWTASYRAELRESRLAGTRTLARAIERLGADAPAAWLSASAVGYYGSQPGRTLTETSAAGDTFLARLCVDWEAEALRAAHVTRVALLRTAPVIHREGVLKPMIRLTALGLGGPIGGGRQTWPWISLDDEVRGIMHAIDHELEGPVNLAGPVPASANEIGRALAQGMRRPFLVRAPRFALNLALGRDATESLLASDALVRPAALERSGFSFSHPTAPSAVRAALT